MFSLAHMYRPQEFLNSQAVKLLDISKLFNRLAL